MDPCDQFCASGCLAKTFMFDITHKHFNQILYTCQKMNVRSHLNVYELIVFSFDKVVDASEFYIVINVSNLDLDSRLQECKLDSKTLCKLSIKVHFSLDQILDAVEIC